MDKLITFTVPCYNSAGYMRHCIDSLLRAGDRAEIIIIDDGSTDETPQIADEYQALHPGVCVAHHQENGGHGEGVNQGLRLAHGRYFKVVDSDDWLDGESLDRFMELLGRLDAECALPDLILCNYVYQHTDGPSHIMRYGNVFPTQPCTWAQSRRMKTTQHFMIHAFAYRTECLRASGLVLPKHTFYVDMLYVYAPLPFVQSIYYLDADLYRYFIGRPDQSVTEANIVKRTDQQVLVCTMMIDSCDMQKIRRSEPKLYSKMCHFLSITLSIVNVFSYIKGTPEALEACNEVWRHLKERDPVLYRKMRWRAVAGLSKLPGKPGRALAVWIYRFTNRKLGLNS